MSAKWKQIATLIYDRLAAETPALRAGYGTLSLDEHRATGTIYFVPTDGVFEPLQEPGGRADPTDANVLKRSICYASQVVRIYCWGADEDTAEALFLNAVVATWEETYGSADFQTFSWITEEQQDAVGFTVLGHVVAFDVKFKIPVVRELQPLATITSIESETEVINPDGDPIVVCTSLT